MVARLPWRDRPTRPDLSVARPCPGPTRVVAPTGRPCPTRVVAPTGRDCPPEATRIVAPTANFPTLLETVFGVDERWPIRPPEPGGVRAEPYAPGGVRTVPAGEVPDQALLATMEQAVACAERVSLK